MSGSTAWVDRYMEIPHAARGMTFDGADCCGLYCLILAHEAGALIAIPDYDVEGDPLKAVRLIRLQVVSGRWRKVAGDPRLVARKFDAILMTDLHIGCATGAGTMVHSEVGIGPRHVPLDDPDIVRRFRTLRHGVYRPVFLDRGLIAA